jgi:hypothetical protein
MFKLKFLLSTKMWQIFQDLNIWTSLAYLKYATHPTLVYPNVVQFLISKGTFCADFDFLKIFIEPWVQS